MRNLELSDLHNPEEIIGFLHKNNNFYEAGENQAFQDYPKSLELWGKLKDGRLMLVKRWYKKSILFINTKS